MDFGDYIVFADESGDHGLIHIEERFPIFVLVFCVFDKQRYVNEVEPAVRRFKFKHFGHDAIVLHEREIRKQQPPFEFLRGDPTIRAAFLADLNGLMAEIPMRVYAAVVDKSRLRERYHDPWNPYELALLFLMEKLCDRLVLDGQRGKKTNVLFESRGRVEDRELELEFRRIADNQRRWGYRAVDFSRCGFDPVFVPKAANMAGHQISDLIARPLGLSRLFPGQPNRAVEVIWEQVADLKQFP